MLVPKLFIKGTEVLIIASFHELFRTNSSVIHNQGTCNKMCHVSQGWVFYFFKVWLKVKSKTADGFFETSEHPPKMKVSKYSSHWTEVKFYNMIMTCDKSPTISWTEPNILPCVGDVSITVQITVTYTYCSFPFPLQNQTSYHMSVTYCCTKGCETHSFCSQSSK